MAGLAADGLPEDLPAGNLSHDALALALGGQYADLWRYVDLWGHWYLWSGTHWRRDDRRRVWTHGPRVPTRAGHRSRPERGNQAALGGDRGRRGEPRP